MAQEKSKKQQTIENMFARMSDTNNNKKNQQQNSIEPPVSFATFQRFIVNLPEIVSQYIQNKTDDSQSFENEAKAYYHDFYAKPEIRSTYPFKLKPCPTSIRNKLLQLPGRGEKQRTQEEASAVSHKYNQEHDKNIVQATTENTGISFDNYIFPVTYETFKKHITNHKSLVKNVIKDQYNPKTIENFKSLYTDKKCYKNTLKLCYKEYFTNQEWRNRYKCEFKDAPRELLTKLLSFGCDGGSKSNEQGNNIIGHSKCSNKGSSINVPSPLEVENQKEIERFKRRIPSSYDDLVKQSFSELPLTHEQFYDKIRNSKKILKEILKFISKDDMNIYHALIFNNEIRQHILCEFYVLFYVFPLVRGIFEIQLKSCPSAVKELFEHVPKITNFLKIDFPVHIKTFKKYANYEEILNQIFPIFGCEDKKKSQKMRSDKMICKRLYEEFFVSYYLAPIITRELINCKFENAPADIKTKLIGGGNSTDEKQSSSSEEENDNHKQQNITHTSYLNMKDFIFPVSFETFRKYIDYDEVMDSLIKPLSHGDKKKYEKLRQDEIFCQARFNTYFYWFYREPKIRSVYKFNFDKAPETLMEKLLSFATRKSPENITIPEQEQDDETTTIQDKGQQESLLISNQNLEEEKNQKHNDEVHSNEANIMPSEDGMSVGQESRPFLALQATYQADPEDEIEQYALQSNDDEESITSDERIINEVKLQNTDNVATEPANTSDDINQNHNLATHEVMLQGDDVPTEHYVVVQTTPNNSENIYQDHLAIQEVNLEEDDVATVPYLEEHSNESNLISAKEIIQHIHSPSSQLVQGAENNQNDHNIFIQSNDTDITSTEETPPELFQQLPPAQVQNEVEMRIYSQVQKSDKNQDHDIIVHSEGTKTTPTEEQCPEEIIQQLPPEKTLAQNYLEPIVSNPFQEVEKNPNHYVDVHSILVNKSLNLPTSLKTFKSLIANIDDLVSRLAKEFSQTHGPMFLASEMRYNFELELYRLFYLLPEIRTFYEFRIKPCPSRTKQALLQIPNSFDKIDVKLPVTIDIFRAFINYNEILDQMTRTYVANDDEENYAKARNDESLCNRLFQSFYYSFYLTPIIIRGSFIYNFHNAPADLKMKLHQFAILIIEDVGGNIVVPSSCDNQTTTITTSPLVNCEITNVKVIKENQVKVTSATKENQVEMSVIPCAAATTSENNLVQKEMSALNCDKVNDRETIQQNLLNTNKKPHIGIDRSPQPESVEVMTTTKSNEQISLNSKDWIFPVTIDIFKKSINYKEIMDKHLNSLVKGDAKQLEKIRNNEKICSAQFRRIYYTFYIKPELRNKIKYNFDAAPNELKEKLLSFALPKIQNNQQQESVVNKDNGKECNMPKNTDEIPNEQRTEALPNEFTKEVCAINKESESVMSKSSNEIPKVQIIEALIPIKSNSELTKEVYKFKKNNESGVSKQIVKKSKIRRTEPFIPQSNKINKKVITMNKINESHVPKSSDQIPKEQRIETLQTESNELTKELITMVKGIESNTATIQRTETLIRKSNESTKEVISNINKDIESEIVSKVTVEIPTENEKTTKTTKENINIGTDVENKLISKSKKTPFVSGNIKFPVSLKIFEKFVNKKQIMDKIVKTYAQQHKIDYKSLRNDQKFCRTQFKKFYNIFYVKANLRKLYDVKFNNAPTDLLKKLWSVATLKETINQSASQQQTAFQVQQKETSTSSKATTTMGHENIKRAEDMVQPINDVILFVPSNLDEYINQRVSDSNLRQLVKKKLIYNQQTHDSNILSYDEVIQQQPLEDSIEIAEKLFFQSLSRFHKTKYLIGSSFGLKQKIWIATTALNIEEFLQFTGIYGANDLYVYSKSYLIRRFYRHAIEEGNWPVNMYIIMPKFVNLMQLKCVQFNDFNLEHISPKLFYWHELMLYTNFDDCVRYDYYKQYRKHITCKSNMHEIRREYYNRCWYYDQWISQIPRVTDQEIIKQVNEINWSKISKGNKKSQNVSKQNSMENETQNDHQNQRSSNVCLTQFTDSLQIIATQLTPTKSNQISGSQQNEHNQRSNVCFKRSQTIITDSLQSTTPTKPITSTQESGTQQNKLNQISSNVFRRSQTIFTDSSQSTTTTRPKLTKSNQIIEIQLNDDSKKKLEKMLPGAQTHDRQLLQEAPRKKLEKTVSGTQIPETQLVESQKMLEKTKTPQYNEFYYDHTYGIHGSTIPPVGLGRECSQNFVDVDNVTLTQSEGLGNNLSVTNEHDPLMSASLNVQEIPIITEIKKEILSPLHDILFLLDSEGSNYTCQPLPENVIQIVDNELTFDNDLRLLLSGDSNDSTFACSKNPQEATIPELNYAILTEEVLQMSPTEESVPDAYIEISITDSAVGPSITTSINHQESTKINHALCCSLEENLPTIANTESANNDDNLKASSSSTSTKTVMARQVAKERRLSDNYQNSKRQKTQHHELKGQLRHEYRALPIQSAITTATEFEAQSVQQDTPEVSNAFNAESGEKQLTISQAFTVDNTLFNSTELQNVLAQHTVQLTSDREKMLQQNNMPSFVTIRKKVINSNSIEYNLIIQKTTTINPPLTKEPLTTTTNIHFYRHLIQFHYIASLNESDIVKYGLLSHGLGQPYQQAVINIDGKSKRKVYGSLMPSLFSNCSEDLQKDFQFVLHDLKKFHYKLYEKNVGEHNDIIKRVLKRFIKSVPIFSNFLLEHKSGHVLPIERTTLKRHSNLNNMRSDNPFTIAIKPHILKRMAQLNGQSKI